MSKSQTPPNPNPDLCRRFLFDGADIRGQTVQLQQCYREIIEVHQYPPGVSRLLGEFLAAAVLLATTLKFAGKLILQARSDGQVPLLMVECSSDRNIRAIARGAEEATAERYDQLLSGGQLAITIDPAEGQRYQGIVPLGDESLAASLEDYFERSEQLQTRLWLACDGRQSGGLLLQQLPPGAVKDSEQREQQWQHACALADTVKPEELLQLPTEDLLNRLYHEEVIRLFDAEVVRFRCSCSRQRTFNALQALGAAEVEELLQELGSITMDCEFCNQKYCFKRQDLGAVLGREAAKILH